MISEIQQLWEQLLLNLTVVNTGVSVGPATPVLAGCLPLFLLFLYFFASSLPPSLPHLATSTSLRHAHQHVQVGTFKRQQCVQSDSGKGPPLPNQSTYLIHLSQGCGLISYNRVKTGGNKKGSRWDGKEERRNKKIQGSRGKGKRIKLKKWWRSTGCQHLVFLPFRSMTHILLFLYSFDFPHLMNQEDIPKFIIGLQDCDIESKKVWSCLAENSICKRGEGTQQKEWSMEWGELLRYFELSKFNTVLFPCSVRCLTIMKTWSGAKAMRQGNRPLLWRCIPNDRLTRALPVPHSACLLCSALCRSPFLTKALSGFYGQGLGSI